MEDWHNFGPDYALTHQALVRAVRPPGGSKRDPSIACGRFFLSSWVGGFKARHSNLWQDRLSKGGLRPRYDRVS